VSSFLKLATSTSGLICRLDFSPAKTSSSFMDSCGGDKGPKSRLNTDHWKKWILNGMAEGIYFILNLFKFRFLKVILTVWNASDFS
jgi:hypothetical protein